MPSESENYEEREEPPIMSEQLELPSPYIVNKEKPSSLKSQCFGSLKESMENSPIDPTIG